MKKTILTLVIALTTLVSFNSCTEQERVRSFGGKMTVELPKGERLMEATWKECNLFYLTEPMDSDYTPKTKTFREDSSWGVRECTIIFVESR